MLEASRDHENPNPSIQFIPEYGVHNAGDISIVSVPTWEQALNSVQSSDFSSNIVLLPELITVAGEDLSSLPQKREEIESKLSNFRQLSKAQPNATFVVGSPHYLNPANKPYNGAFIIRDGEIVDISHKRLGALREEEDLLMDRTFSPTQIQDANLLICRDLSAAPYAQRPTHSKLSFFKFATNDPAIADELIDTQFIDPSIKRLLIISCWGIGIHPLIPTSITPTQDALNKYYQRSLQFALFSTFKYNPQIDEIIVCDRAPTSDNPLQDRVADIPMSAIAHR